MHLSSEAPAIECKKCLRSYFVSRLHSNQYAAYWFMWRCSSCCGKGNQEQCAYFEVLLFIKKVKQNTTTNRHLDLEYKAKQFYLASESYYACHEVASWHNLNIRGPCFEIPWPYLVSQCRCPTCQQMLPGILPIKLYDLHNHLIIRLDQIRSESRFSFCTEILPAFQQQSEFME